jgi:hypothetical protein
LVQRSLQSRPKTEQKPTRPDPKQISLCGTASRHRRASSEQQRSKVGFPIRKFTDQSLFAAPHDLSQRTTSFIASQRQGIHQIPLRHLIALIAKARSHVCSRFGNRKPNACFGLEKTSFASNASGDLSGQAPNPRLVARWDKMTTRRLSAVRSSRTLQRTPRLIRPSTECASSSQCQKSRAERNGGG